MDALRDDRSELLLVLARGLHQAGLPTDTIEQTLRDVALTLGVILQVNVLPTSITLAVGAGFAQQLVIVRLEPGQLHLRKLALLDGVLGTLRSGADPAAVLAEIAAVDTVERPDPVPITIGAYAMLSCGTALLLGGARNEVVVSTLGGIAIGAIAALAQRSRRVSRVYEISAAFVATVIVALWERFIGPIALYVAIIAGVVQLLPGYSLTTALSELANRNLVSGTSRLGGVLVTLLSLGCGFALGAGLTGNAIFNGPTVSPGHVTPLTTTAAAVLMALAIAMMLHARYRDLGWIVASCGATIALARTLPLLGITQTAPFATAFAIGLLATLAARYLRIPPPIVLVPSLLVLVPGSLSYESFLYVFQADATDALSLAVRALLAAILIVAGFLTSQLLAPAERHA
ncbi:membrane protein [Vulcanimicrobium alpinum]|uniref:Membrane protein n=1 Tax=Vulcanimicrobium alpinum TaxID=3016050 RepID=A0AAN1XYS1_UNVUL|nr:threonine/serine exporter family protein [Vulcanimicrobium alpinum]BDE06712.1 membrane protein [Vulcanimicrobium alpinum]